MFKRLHLKGHAEEFYPLTQKLETPYVRDSLIHSLSQVKGLVYRHFGLVNTLYMFFFF